MFGFKAAFNSIKSHPGAFAVIILAIVVFAGSAIVGVYNSVRAKVPVLPAAK